MIHFLLNIGIAAVFTAFWWGVYRLFDSTVSLITLGVWFVSGFLACCWCDWQQMRRRDREVLRATIDAIHESPLPTSYAIWGAVECRLGRQVPLGEIYAVIEVLERNGYAYTWGRPSLHVELSPLGESLRAMTGEDAEIFLRRRNQRR